MNWTEIIEGEKEKDYYKNIEEYLNNNPDFYPPKDLIFNAFEKTPINSIKVVILSQDPYHGVGQANGLAFSVNKGIKIPPSLRNIFKEIESEYNTNIENPSGDLTNWANQGVLLLNSILTVEKSKPESHKNIGWTIFTDNIIKYISDNKKNVVFLLWGGRSIKKESIIDDKNHLILKSAHPSPLSSYRGFFGNNHFIKCNDYLISNNIDPIKWI